MTDKLLNIWSTLERRFLPEGVWLKDPLTFWRERVLFIIVFFASAFGPIALIPSLWLAYFEGLWNVILIDLSAYGFVVAVLFGKRWSLRTRGYLVCGVLFCLGISLSIILGPLGAGYIWLFGASILVSILIGPQAALWSLLVNAAALTGVAVYILTGSPPWALQMENPFQKWAVTAGNFILLNMFITITVGFMLDRIKRDFLKEQEISNDLRKSQHDLQLHQERFVTVLDSIDATIYVSDLKSHEILFMNKRMIESYGQDHTGKKCWSALRGASGPCTGCHMDHLFSEDGDLSEVHVWHEQNPVTKKWTVNHDRAIRWTDGRLAKIQIATDVTELKKMEAELRQTHKMEAIGTLAGGIAHDFNNILSAIIGYTELALDESPQGSLLEEDLQEVFKAAKRARDLVRQILDFARQSDEKINPMQIKTLVKEALKLLRSSIPSTIEIRQGINSNSLIEGNAGQVHRVVMNLCTNAVQAMPDGGILTVGLNDTSFEDSDPERPEGLAPGEYVALTVDDTGSGIDPAIVSSIFEPYFTTKEPGEGTGMGLATVQGVVESYGGKVTANNRNGSGATFNVYFPKTKNSTKPSLPVVEALPGGDEHILFVDDEIAIAKMGYQALRRLGYRVTMDTNPVSALERFRQKPDVYDLVITDMTMPHMTGDRLAMELIRSKPDIRVILCTGYSARISEEGACKLGIKALVYKPLVKKELANVVRTVLDSA